MTPKHLGVVLGCLAGHGLRFKVLMAPKLPIARIRDTCPRPAWTGVRLQYVSGFPVARKGSAQTAQLARSTSRKRWTLNGFAIMNWAPA
jgi:hypothetical protein